MELVTPSRFAAMRNDDILFQLVRGRPLLRTAHRHTFFELVCVLNGSCCHELDGTPEELTAGDVVWIAPEQTHCFRSQSESVVVASLSVTAAHQSSVGVAQASPKSLSPKTACNFAMGAFLNSLAFSLAKTIIFLLIQK